MSDVTTPLTVTDGQEKDEMGDVYHDEHTLRKVYDALAACGIHGPLATQAVNNMQGLGILFRERGKF